MSTVVDLPLPPSVSPLWRVGRRRVYRSPCYHAWRRQAGWTQKMQRPAKLSGPVAITIAAGKLGRRKRDLDNLGKIVRYLLVALSDELASSASLDQIDLLVGEGANVLPVNAKFADHFSFLEYRRRADVEGTAITQPQVAETWPQLAG